jgi:precorrin-6A/cobalt-precorrin-6A reductase
VVMIERPPLPAGVRTVSTVDEAVDWIAGLSPGSAAG